MTAPKKSVISIGVLILDFNIRNTIGMGFLKAYLMKPQLVQLMKDKIILALKQGLSSRWKNPFFLEGKYYTEGFGMLLIPVRIDSC